MPLLNHSDIAREEAIFVCFVLFKVCNGHLEPVLAHKCCVFGFFCRFFLILLLEQKMMTPASSMSFDIQSLLCCCTSALFCENYFISIHLCIVSILF